jgi:cleavage and polyadenylation specificity factor subunit 1
MASSDPKSLQGHRLLQLSTFNTGAYPSTMTLLPQISPPQERKPTDSRSPDAAEPLNGRYMILITSQTGAISLLTSLSLSDYRTLSALQAYLTNTISHPLALNAKAYRAVEADSSIGGRAILDGDILKKWMDLASWKRVEGVSRAGAESEWEMQRLLNKIMGIGVGLLDGGASG